MAYEYKVSRLEKILEDGVIKRLCIGVNCYNTITEQSSYMDWEALVKDVGKTKIELKAYIKNYLIVVTNQAEIDAKTVEKETNPEAVIPEAIKRIDGLKAQTLAPIITRENETVLGEDTSLTI